MPTPDKRGKVGTHPCPAGCGQPVSNRLFACRSCWSILPRDLQRPIVATAKLSLLAPARMDAVTDAMQFYRELAAAQPAPGAGHEAAKEGDIQTF